MFAKEAVSGSVCCTRLLGVWLVVCDTRGVGIAIK